MSKQCAYCGKVGPFTREHIYPDFLTDSSIQTILGYNESADKVTRGERLIKDVCVTCNNGPLADLDGYGKQYFQENRLDDTFKSNADVV